MSARGKKATFIIFDELHSYAPTFSPSAPATFPCPGHTRTEQRKQYEDATLREALNVIRDRATRSTEREHYHALKRLAGSFKKIMEL